MIAVTFALPAESSDFVRLLRNRRGSGKEVRGSLHGRAISILHTGVGEQASRAAVVAFLQREPFAYLISAGFAGALHPELRVADVLLARNYSDDSFIERAGARVEKMAIRISRLATAKLIIGSAAEREELAARTGAAAVDMESEFIAAACAGYALPMISLRSISDTITKPFPAPPHVLFNVAKQKTDAVQLALYLATHPATVVRLLRFSRQITKARSALTRALSDLIGSDLL